MIEDQKQYEITKAQLEKFKLAVKNFNLELVAKKAGSKVLAEAELRSMESMIEDLKSQMEEYQAKARNLIRFYMRMMDGGYYPVTLKHSEDSELAKLVDRQTAQRMYEEEIALIEKETNAKVPRKDSDIV